MTDDRKLDGIDVSHYQGSPASARPDWAAVLTDPRIRFVAVKATQGLAGQDPEFKANWTDLRRLVPAPAGEPGAPLLIAYHFFDRGDPKAQAAHFVNVVGRLRPGEGLMGDFEGRTAGSHQEQAAWLDETQRLTGRLALRYGSDEPQDSATAGWPRWIARYRSACPVHTCAIWQYGGANVPGITGAVDANRVYDWAAVRQSCGLAEEGDDEMWTDAEKARLLAGADAAVALEKRWDASGRTKLDDIWTEVKATDHPELLAGMVKELVDGTKPVA